MEGRFVLRHAVILGLLVFSSSAFALEQLGAVSQVVQNRKVVEFSISSTTLQVQQGTQITIRFQDNINCEATVDAVAEKLARASLADCERFGSIVVGQAVLLSAFQTQTAAVATAQVVTTAPTNENTTATAAAAATATATTVITTEAPKEVVAPSVAVEPTPAPVEETPSVMSPPRLKTTRFALGVLASGADKLKFKDVTLQSGSATEDAEMELKSEGAGGVFAELFIAAPNSSGISLGLSYDMSREFKSGNVTVAGSTYASTIDDVEVTYLTLYANYVYQFDKSYIFGGLNFTDPNFDDDELDSYAKGSVGFQAGGGWFLNDSTVLEAGIRQLGIFIDPVVDGTDSVNMNYGSTLGAQLNLKFFLK